MRHKLMKLILLFVLFVFLMSLFTSTFVSALQESDDNSDESTTVSSRQRRGRCLVVRDSLVNGWVRMRNKGRIAKFFCNNGYDLVGNRISTCIQGKWNNPLPVCASRGCGKLQIGPHSSSEELYKGTVFKVSCQSGYSFLEHLSSYRIYCNGSDWRLLGSSVDLSKTDSDRYLCKKSDTSGTESHFITSEEISTISPLNSAVTAKSETTTNSKFNSKMPEMTAMFVSSVINITAMSTESTSLFADNSKTPITEPIDKSYTSTNATNIIQEVSTLTTTTTIRFNTLQTQTPISSTETIPKMHFTTLSKDFSQNQTNYSTKSPQLSFNATQNSRSNVSSIKSPSTFISTKVPIVYTTEPLKYTSEALKLTTEPMKSTSEALKLTSDPMKSTSELLKLTSNPMNSTTEPLKSTLISTTSTLLSSSKQSIQSLTTRVSILLPDMRRPTAPTIGSNLMKVITSGQTLTTEGNISSLLKDVIVQNSTKLMDESERKKTSVSGNSPNIEMGTTDGSKGPEMTTNSVKEVSQTNTEMSVSTALNSQSERSTVKISANKMTVPNERHAFVSTMRESLSTPSIDSMKYSLFAENTTITPMRRRRQFSTKTRLVVTSIASESEKNTTFRGLTISVTVISMTILVTILSLYLIKKRKNTQQNRISEDSEMRYLSSNEVF